MTIHSFPVGPRTSSSVTSISAATEPLAGDEDKTSVRGGAPEFDDKDAPHPSEHLQAVMDRVSSFIHAEQNAAASDAPADLDMPATAVASGLPPDVTPADLAHVIDASKRRHLDGCDFAPDCSCFC